MIPRRGHINASFFDTQGNTTTQHRHIRTASGPGSELTRAALAVFIDNGQTLTARHEGSADGVHWKPSMNVTLQKVD
jgi:hypothetical protein